MIADIAHLIVGTLITAGAVGGLMAGQYLMLGVGVVGVILLGDGAVGCVLATRRLEDGEGDACRGATGVPCREVPDTFSGNP